MSVLGDDVLLEGVALRETLVAVVAHEVTALLVYRLHVLLQTRSLKHDNNLMAIPLLKFHFRTVINFFKEDKEGYNCIINFNVLILELQQ